MSKVNATINPIDASVSELWFGNRCSLTPAPFALIVKYVSNLAHIGSMLRIFDLERATDAIARLETTSVPAQVKRELEFGRGWATKRLHSTKAIAAIEDRGLYRGDRCVSSTSLFAAKPFGAIETASSED